MYQLNLRTSVLCVACCGIVVLAQSVLYAEDAPKKLNTANRLVRENSSAASKINWRQVPREPSWAGIGVDSYWPEVGIEYPPRPRDSFALYDIDYSSFYETVLIPAADIPAEDKVGGSRFSWLNNEAYSKLNELQDEELNARYILESPWRKWMIALFKDPERIKKVISIKHSRVFSQRYGDALYDYALDNADGWQIRFIISSQHSRIPFRLEFLRKQAIPQNKISEIRNQLNDAIHLREVTVIAEILSELPIVDFHGGDWELKISESRGESGWVEASFTGPLAGKLANQLEFIVGTEGVFVRLSGPGVLEMAREESSGAIWDGPLVPAPRIMTFPSRPKDAPLPREVPALPYYGETGLVAEHEESGNGKVKSSKIATSVPKSYAINEEGRTVDAVVPPASQVAPNREGGEAILASAAPPTQGWSLKQVILSTVAIVIPAVAVWSTACFVRIRRRRHQ